MGAACCVAETESFQPRAEQKKSSESVSEAMTSGVSQLGKPISHKKATEDINGPQEDEEKEQPQQQEVEEKTARDEPTIQVVDADDDEDVAFVKGVFGDGFEASFHNIAEARSHQRALSFVQRQEQADHFLSFKKQRAFKTVERFA